MKSLKEAGTERQGGGEGKASHNSEYRRGSIPCSGTTRSCLSRDREGVETCEYLMSDVRSKGTAGDGQSREMKGKIAEER